MNYNELTGSPLYKAVRAWLDNNPGKDLGDFTKATGYTGPELQVKDKKTGRIGLRTRNTDVERAARIAAQDQEYLDTLINGYGYSEKDAKDKLKQAKTKVKQLRGQVADLNKQFGKGSFTVGHLTAVAEGGGDFGRNVRLEIGKSVDGKRGNFSRAAVDELPKNIKAVLGIPSSGREAAIMDHEGLFDLELTPQDRQRIFQNPTAEFADEVIGNRLAEAGVLKSIEAMAPPEPLGGYVSPGLGPGDPFKIFTTAHRPEPVETGTPGTALTLPSLPNTTGPQMTDFKPQTVFNWENKPVSKKEPEPDLTLQLDPNKAASASFTGQGLPYFLEAVRDVSKLSKTIGTALDVVSGF